MTAISVIVPTNRPGGLDVLFDGLSKQTFSNFEVIISDCLFKYREEIVRERAKQYGVNYLHIEPFENSFPRNIFCRTSNTGIAYASGKLVLFVVDYTWLAANSLQVHWDYFCSHNQSTNKGFMGPLQYLQPTKLKEGLPHYKVVQQWISHENEAINKKQFDQYLDDIRTGKFSDYMWSIFERDFDHNVERELGLAFCPFMANTDPKLYMASGDCPANVFHGKNESVPLARVLEKNGWNEEMDGEHGWQDSEFAERLDISWQLDRSNIAYIVNPRYIFPPLTRQWSGGHCGNEVNARVLEKLKSEGYPNRNFWKMLKK